MKRIFLFAAVTAVAMSSCSKNEVEINKMDPANAIGFGTYVGGNTKALVEENFGADDVINIDAYYTAQATMAAGSQVAFMQDQAVKFDGTDWSYSPIKYWPNNTDDMVSFFAVSDATTTEYLFNDLSGKKPSFTVAAASSDIMVASMIDQKKPDDGIVHFKFKHTMSQVNFTVKLKEALDEADKTNVQVTEFKIEYTGAAAGGTFVFENDPAATVIGSWTAGTGADRAADVWDATGDAGILVDLNENGYGSPAESVIGEPLMILPVSGASYKATLTYFVNTVDAGTAGNANDSKIVNVCTFNIAPEDMNTIYNYNMVIGLKSVDVTAEILGWESTEVEKTVTVETSTGAIS